MIRKRGDRQWQIVVYLGTHPDGRERRVYRTYHGSRTEAQDVERRMILDARGGQLTTGAGTLAELLDAWLAHIEPDRSATTIYNYRSVIDRHINPALGDVKLAKLTTARLDRFYDQLRTKLATKTVRNVHSVLRRALTQAQRWDWITTNPAVNASPPPVGRPDIHPPGREELAAFLAAVFAEDPDFGILVWVAAVTGARRGELAGLRWTDVDLDTATLLIERAVVQIGARLITKSTKTRQARRIALDSATVALLERHRARLAAYAQDAGTTFTTDLAVFADEQLHARHPDAISKQWRRVADAHGIPGRLHDLRHFAATAALGAGVPVRTVAGRLGHANTSTTLNVYSHFLAASDRDAADILGELLASKTPELPPPAT